MRRATCGGFFSFRFVGQIRPGFGDGLRFGGPLTFFVLQYGGILIIENLSHKVFTVNFDNPFLLPLGQHGSWAGEFPVLMTSSSARWFCLMPPM